MSLSFSGVHVLQLIEGCEWDVKTGEVISFSKYGYDGEDFISFDLKTLKWIALKPQAVAIKQEWDADEVRINVNLNHFTKVYPEWLKEYSKYVKGSPLRTGGVS